MKLSQHELDRINDFIEKSDNFFVNWFNGNIDQNQLSEISETMHDNLQIVFSHDFDQLRTKQDLLELMPRLHGRSADQPIARRSEIRHCKKLGEGYVLVSTIEHSLQNDKITRSRPMSVILTLTEPMQILYSHE